MPYTVYYDYDYIMIMKPFWMNESVNHYVSSHALHDSIMSTNLLCWWVEHRPWTWHEWRYLVFWSYKLYPAACWVHWTDSGPQDLHPCRWLSFQTPSVGIISKLTVICSQKLRQIHLVWLDWMPLFHFCLVLQVGDRDF